MTEETAQELLDSSAGPQPTGDYTEVIQNLLHSKSVILSVSAIVMMCSILYFSSKPNLYSATSKIIIEKTSKDAPRSSQDMMIPTFGGEEDYYGTQVAILTGQKISAAVAEEIPEARKAVVAAKRVRGTRILILSVVHHDPKLAAAICNKYGEIFVRESSKENLYVSRQILNLIPDNSESLANPEANATMATSIEGRVGKFSKKEFAESLSNVSNDPVIQKQRAKRIELESKVAELSQRYRSEHPILKQAREQLNYAEAELKARTDVILNNLKANLAGDINITNVRILEEAVPPQKPFAPKRFSGVLMHTLLGFVGSCSLVLFFEHSNQKIRAEKDLLPMIQLPFLGYIPFARNFLKNKKGITKDVFDRKELSYLDILRENSILSDAVASVRTHLLFSMPYEKSRKIMLTSAIPNEGKSTVAVLLALSLTTLGRKILLVDGDLRKPYLHSYLGLKNEKGLADYLIGAEPLENVIRDVPGCMLKVVTAGSASPNPSELLSSESFRLLLEKSLEMFDRVIIDVPPVLYIPDGLVVAKHVHSSVLVCGSGMVFKKVVQTVVEKFDAIGHSFIGVVINRADYEHEKYRYKYFNVYKNYYSKSAAPERLKGWVLPISEKLKSLIPGLGKS